MGERQSSRDVAAVTPARDPWAEGYNPAGRDYDGGGYQRQVQAHQAVDAIEWAKPEGDQTASLASGGAPDSWWSDGAHWAG